MSDHNVAAKAEGRIFAVITRADGTVEDLGCISEFEPTPEDIALMQRALREEEEVDGDGL